MATPKFQAARRLFTESPKVSRTPARATSPAREVPESEPCHRQGRLLPPLCDCPVAPRGLLECEPQPSWRTFSGLMVHSGWGGCCSINLEAALVVMAQGD